MKLSEYYKLKRQTGTQNTQPTNVQAPISNPEAPKKSTYSNLELPNVLPKNKQDIALIDPRTPEGKQLQEKLLSVINRDEGRINAIARNTPPPLEVNGRRLVPKGALQYQAANLRMAEEPTKMALAAARMTDWNMKPAVLTTYLDYPQVEQEKELEKIQKRGEALADQYRKKIQAEYDEMPWYMKAGGVINTIGAGLEGFDRIYQIGKDFFGVRSNPDGTQDTVNLSGILGSFDDDGGIFIDPVNEFEGIGIPGDYSVNPFDDSGIYIDEDLGYEGYGPPLI